MSSPHPDVVVVGAGFAGLSAAVRLVEHGARVLVVEERRRLGGRATAFPDAITGDLVDNGQHALFGCYDETFAFLRAIGAEADVALDERLELEIVDQRGTRSRLRTADVPAPFHLVAGLVRWSVLGVADRLAALRLGAVLRRLGRTMRAGHAPDARLDLLTVNEWLIEQGQTVRLRELLWEPLAIAALNQSPAVAAAATFVHVLARMFSGTRRDAAIGLPRSALDSFYAEPARRFLETRGSALRAGSPARLAVEGTRAIGVRVRDETVPAGAVVSTVPWFSVDAFVAGLPALEPLAHNARLMVPSPIVTVNLWLDRDITDVPFVGLPGRTFQWVFDKSRIVDDRGGHLSLISSGADDVVALGNEALIERALRELADALPPAKGVQVRRASVVREKRATFSLAPGQPPRPGPVTAIEGLILAGDWTDTGLPATIEGAVLSGHRAADLVARRAPHL